MLLYISIILLVLRQYSKQFTKQSTNQIGRSHSCHFLSVLLCKNNSLFNEHPPVCLLIAGGLSRRYIRAQQPDYRRRTDSQDRAFRNGAERHWKGELVFFFLLLLMKTCVHLAPCAGLPSMTVSYSGHLWNKFQYNGTTAVPGTRHDFFGSI